MKSSIADFDLQNKTVLLRIDANVPVKNGIVLNDQRLIACLPTINLLLDKGAQIILLTHMGRPQDKERSLSTRQLLPWFDENGFDVTFAQDIEQAAEKKQENNRIILLENLRFFQGEKEHDHAFAQRLASLGQFYINDAFGTAARKDTSITLLPDYFDEGHKTIGLLMKHEVEKLDQIKANSPGFNLIIGGGKVSGKIDLIQQLLPKLKTVFLGPAIVFTFLKAQGEKVGVSLVDSQALNICKDILMQAQQLGVKVVYPQDYIIAEGSFEGPLDITEDGRIPAGYAGVSIGPKTAEQWAKKIRQSKDTIVVNGLMGTINRPETLIYMQNIYNALAQTEAATLIAGGDSVAALHYFDRAKDVDYLSTGGSATLQYIAQDSLPALTALKNGTKAQ